MTTQQHNQPVRMPVGPRYIVRADDGVSIREVGHGKVLLAGITFAQQHNARTGEKVWIVDVLDARRTVYRLERRERTAEGGGR